MTSLKPKSLYRELSLTLILVFVVLVITPGDGHAYATKYRWPQNQRSVTYWIYTDLSDKLFPNGGAQAGQTKVVNAIVDSAHQWNISSGFQFNRTTTFVERHWDAYDLNHPNTFAVAPVSISGSTITRARTVFNNGPQFTWHTNGTQGPRSGGGWNADVYKVALHEWGHWIFLLGRPTNIHHFPNPPAIHGNTVMWFDGGGSKHLLVIDDKEGATMTYGIETGFSDAQFLGLYPNTPPNPNQNVGTYLQPCTSATGGTPDYWTYPAGEDGVGELGTGKGRFMRFRGCAKSSSNPAKAYMTLAGDSHPPGGDGSATGVNADGTIFVIPNCGANCYQKIQTGMNLRWLQRNVEGCAAIISFEFTDGTFLHSTQYDVRDTSGRTIVPAGRCSYFPPGGQPHYVQINFNAVQNSAVIGKTIKRYMVIYDNTGLVSNQRWRIYFDDVILSY